MPHLLQEFLTAPWLYVFALTAIGFMIVHRTTRAALALWFLVLLLFLHNCAWTFSRLAEPLIADSNQLSLNTGCLDSYPVLVVLGGGVASKEKLSDATTERILKAAEFLRDRSKAVIVSGGPTLVDGVTTEAALGERDLRQTLGNDRPLRVWREERSLTTYENAVRTRELMETQRLGRQVILVTSVFHMSRAAAVFTTQGFEVCALPSYPLALGLQHLLSFANAAPIAMLIHEYVGHWYYKWRGWI